MSHGHILLVEDNPDDADLTTAALKQHFAGVEITTAEDGVEALELLTARVANQGTPRRLPNFVLLDLKLPRMDGHELLKAIRDDPEMAHLPVVILTSSGEESDIRKSYALGVNSYVRKPVNFDEFSTLAEQLGHYWLHTNCASPALGKVSG